MIKRDLKDWLPTTKKEIEIRGWDSLDVIIFSGDSYIDHPSFGAAVIGRFLESQGMKVAIVPQPDWRGDHRDFTKLGKPNLFFAVTAGCMDSMVNHYTANKRLRSDDAYTAGGKSGSRPDYATITYTNIIKKLYPDVPVLIGGIEASLRRLTHYDYWSDKLMPGILIDSQADLLVYGMGEKPLKEICLNLKSGKKLDELNNIPQTVYLREKATTEKVDSIIYLHSHEECLKSKKCQAENFKHIEEESNKMEAKTLIQAYGNRELVVNAPYPPMSTEELDFVHDLPFTMLPHPKYKDKIIPAYEMIKFSVNIHRGCFGGCSFCTISAHQGKFITSRSKESIIREVKKITKMDSFKGYLSDLGGPSANMYMMQGKDLTICQKCKRPSCIYPKVCNNLNTDHKPLIDIYKSVDKIPGIKKSFIGSGIRYDMLTYDAKDRLSKSSEEYLEEVVFNHVSGRLKVAPEHTSKNVLKNMRKADFDNFKVFKKQFDLIEDKRLKMQKSGKQQLIPYFISSHPGCTEEDMATLAADTKELNFKLEQVQDFTPTPMTLATEMYYTGLDPYDTSKTVYVAKNKEEKLNQRQYFFWYERDKRDAIIRKLKRLNRNDLIKRIFG